VVFVLDLYDGPSHEILVVQMIETTSNDGKDEPLTKGKFIFTKQGVYSLHLFILPKDVPKAASYNGQDDIFAY
jgi:hypothetical protein